MRGLAPRPAALRSPSLDRGRAGPQRLVEVEPDLDLGLAMSRHLDPHLAGRGIPRRGFWLYGDGQCPVHPVVTVVPEDESSGLPAWIVQGPGPLTEETPNREDVLEVGGKRQTDRQSGGVRVVASARDAVDEAGSIAIQLTTPSNGEALLGDRPATAEDDLRRRELEHRQAAGHGRRSERIGLCARNPQP